ncbi:MAG: hypothetical protein AAF502_12795 [Bacteroidota bacterium]
MKKLVFFLTDREVANAASSRATLSFIMSLALILFLSSPSDARDLGKKRPPKPDNIEEVVPESPSPFHEWNEGRWKWNKKQQTYIWKAGKWRLSNVNRYSNGFSSPYYYAAYPYSYRYQSIYHRARLYRYYHCL